MGGIAHFFKERGDCFFTLFLEGIALFEEGITLFALFAKSESLSVALFAKSKRIAPFVKKRRANRSWSLFFAHQE